MLEPVRSCGTCTLCCKVMKIESAASPRGKWCQHCEKGMGCRIYATRPQECRDFYCSFVLDDSMPEYWNPIICGMVITLNTERNCHVIYVNDGQIGAWRKEPYRQDLFEVSANFFQSMGPILVRAGRRAFAIFPDKEIDLGYMTDAQGIMYEVGPAGVTCKVIDMPATQSFSSAEASRYAACHP